MMTERKPTFTVLDEPSEGGAALDEVSTQLEHERDARMEERFLFVVALIVVSDAFMFSAMDNWAGALVIGVIELVGLAVMARKWGVEEVSQFLAMFFQNMADRSRPPAANNQPTVGSLEPPSRPR
jgi:hypothetical protein